jgi:DNA-binding winged helix-turn-helix (wHTH) protein
MTTNTDTEFAPHCVSLPTDEVALEFGRFRMLLRQRQLIADDVPVKLGTRALDILLVLMEADGSLVTKEDLLARVWPGIHVSEENLKIQISVLRKALGENRDFIRTEVGRGYCFTAAVESIAVESAFQHAVRRRQRSGQKSRWMSILSLPRCSHRNAHLSTEPISRLCKALAFAVGLGLSAFSYAADAAVPGGSGTVQSLYDALLDTMKNGRALGESGRFAHLAPVIRSSFDVPSMARLSVGPVWTGLSEAQRQEMTESYARYISAIYADRFDSYLVRGLK